MSFALAGLGPGTLARADSDAVLPDSRDLTQISLQELMNVEVTSVSRKEQKLSAAPAAVYVISSEDIRRSGATSIPEVLRMVPGLQVARINLNEWAISSRGFNDRFADKMLVLIDGRSVYTPLFSGVYWDMQDTLLEDIDRIEVIRGPGATMWGANAVNGAINILTKRAADTQGTLVTSGGGNQEQTFSSMRYGGKTGNVAYRVYGKYGVRRSEGPGATFDDRWTSLRGGFRMDWDVSPKDSLTIQGDIYQQQISGPFGVTQGLATQIVNNQLRPDGGNFLGRWRHAFSDSSETTLQIYYDRYRRVDGFLFGDHRHTVDMDFDHRLAVSPRHELLWGFQTRFAADRVDDRLYIHFVPPNRDDYLLGGFLQDDISLVPDRLHLILGSKLEHSSFGDVAIQPSVQASWTPDARHTVWASVARAMGCPSRVDQDTRITATMPFTMGGLPVRFILSGNPDFEPEEVIAYQVGTRLQPAARFSFDLATFYNQYRRLSTADVAPPAFHFAPPPPYVLLAETFIAQMHGETYGLEAVGNWNVLKRWRLSAAYSYLSIELHRAPGSTDPYAEMQEGESPVHQGTLRSYLDITRAISLDTLVSFVDRLPAQHVPGYARVDGHFSWRPSQKLEFSVGAENLSGRRQFEFNPPFERTGNDPEQFGRNIYGKVAWRF